MMISFFTENIKKYYDYFLEKIEWNLREIYNKDFSFISNVLNEHVSILLNIHTAVSITKIIRNYIRNIKVDKSFTVHKNLEYHYNNFFSQMYIIYNSLKLYLGYIKNNYKTNNIPSKMKILQDKLIDPFFEQYNNWRSVVVHPLKVRKYIPDINELSMYSTLINVETDVEIKIILEKLYKITLKESRIKYLETIDNTISNLFTILDNIFTVLFKLLIINNELIKKQK
jgi:hypothetical protein